MAWTWYSGKACFFSGNSGDMILQPITQIDGGQYIIKFSISAMTQGKLRIGNYDENFVFLGNGTYAVIGTAQNGTLVFFAETDQDDNLFNGCIDSVEVFTFENQTSIACSPCINVRETQDSCYLVMTAENSGNALNFDWADLTLKARVPARFARGSYTTTKEALDDNNGDHIVTYFDGKKNKDLLIEAAPGFIHDFLYMCMGVDTFKINDVEYSLIDDEYPELTWNKSMTEATAELKIRKKNFKLNKTNC